MDLSQIGIVNKPLAFRFTYPLVTCYSDKDVCAVVVTIMRGGMNLVQGH